MVIIPNNFSHKNVEKTFLVHFHGNRGCLQNHTACVLCKMLTAYDPSHSETMIQIVQNLSTVIINAKMVATSHILTKLHDNKYNKTAELLPHIINSILGVSTNGKLLWEDRRSHVTNKSVHRRQAELP